MTVKTYVTEDWQRDALHLVLVDHDARRVAIVQGGGPLSGPPVLQMTTYDPEAMTPAGREEVGIPLPLSVAREVYEALGRHFGDHQDPGSRELVEVLKDVQAREAERVDLLIAHATMPPMVLRAPVAPDA